MRKLAAVGLIAAVLSSSACASDSTPEYPELPNVTIQIPEEPGGQGELNEHGFVDKEFGKPGFAADPETLDRFLAIAPTTTADDWPCEVPSGNGRYLAIAFELKTTPAFDPTKLLGENSFRFMDGTFQAFTEDGLVVNAPVPDQTQCVPPHLAPPEDLTANQTGIGWVLFDLPESASSISYSASWGGGWEWQLP